jgi:preprotein translocase subunit YajC
MTSSSLILLYFAQSSGTAAGALLLPVILMVGIAYFILILPNQRRQKKWHSMLEALKTGDRVITSGGIRGTIVALKDDSLHLRVPPDNLRLEVSKAAVVSVATAEEGK